MRKRLGSSRRKWMNGRRMRVKRQKLRHLAPMSAVGRCICRMGARRVTVRLVHFYEVTDMLQILLRLRRQDLLYLLHRRASQSIVQSRAALKVALVSTWLIPHGAPFLTSSFSRAYQKIRSCKMQTSSKIISGRNNKSRSRTVWTVLSKTSVLPALAPLHHLRQLPGLAQNPQDLLPLAEEDRHLHRRHREDQ
jgi:hypothetical protein